MAARPSWTGHIRISLVSFPVQLYSGAKPARRTALHQIHAPTGQRVHNQPVLEGGKRIEKSDIIKGYEYEKGQYVTLTPDEIKEIRLPTKETVDINEFVDIGEIDAIYYDTPYFIVPHVTGKKDKTGQEAFAVFREALKKTGKAAIGEVVLSGKEHLVAIRPCGRGMMLETLRYADELREAADFFKDIETTTIDKEQLALATSLIKQKTGSFKVEKYDDSYESALHELIGRKLKNKPLRDESDDEDDRGGDNVISLMDALKRSVGTKNKTGTAKPAKKTTAKKPAAKKATSKPKKKKAA